MIKVYQNIPMMKWKVPAPTKAANLEEMMKTFEETEKICEVMKEKIKKEEIEKL